MRALITWPVNKWRDIPTEMKPAFEKIAGGLPSVAYKNGHFYKNIWVQTRPYYWPELVQIKLDKDDAIVMRPDFGVEAVVLGALINDTTPITTNGD